MQLFTKRAHVNKAKYILPKFYLQIIQFFKRIWKAESDQMSPSCGFS